MECVGADALDALGKLWIHLEASWQFLLDCDLCILKKMSKRNAHTGYGLEGSANAADLCNLPVLKII